MAAPAGAERPRSPGTARARTSCRRASGLTAPAPAPARRAAGRSRTPGTSTGNRRSPETGTGTDRTRSPSLVLLSAAEIRRRGGARARRERIVAQHLHVVGPLERGAVADGPVAHAALHLPDGLVLVLGHPVEQPLPHGREVLDAVLEQGRRHHRRP